MCLRVCARWGVGVGSARVHASMHAYKYDLDVLRVITDVTRSITINYDGLLSSQF